MFVEDTAHAEFTDSDMLCPNQIPFFSSFRIFRTSVPVCGDSSPDDGGGTLIPRGPELPRPLGLLCTHRPASAGFTWERIQYAFY